MDKELKEIAVNYKLDTLYKNNLFSIKSICEHLNIWDNYNNEQKFNLENLTKRDSVLNKNFEYKGKYNKNLTYGEITRNGVEQIIEKIHRHKKTISTSDVFVDVGSGCGKLLIHTSLRLNLKTYVGVEIVEARVKYAKHILEQFSPLEDNKKIFFINKDINDFDLSIANIVFIDNVTFSNRLCRQIYDKLPSGCHFITHKPFDQCKYLKESFAVDVSWSKSPYAFHYYIK